MFDKLKNMFKSPEPLEPISKEAAKQLKKERTKKAEPTKSEKVAILSMDVDPENSH
jgi:hypothetical protein